MARSGNTYNMQSSLVDCSCFFNSYMRSTFKDDFSGRFCAHQWGYTFDSDQRLFPLATLGVISLNILGGVETSMQTLFHIIFVFQPVKKTEFEGIYYDLLHVCDLALYMDMYASSFLVWTADRKIFDAATKDERLIELFRRYISWCKENRTSYHQLSRVLFAFEVRFFTHSLPCNWGILK